MTDEDEVRTVDAARREAMLAADVETLRGILDQDVLWIHGSARVDTQETFLAGIASGASRYRSIAVEAEQYRQLGPGVMLATCITTMDVDLDDEPRQIRVRNVLVWQRIGGAWRLVSYQSTAIRVA